MNDMSKHLITAFVGAVLAVSVVAAADHYRPRKIISTTTQRALHGAWRELDQSEVDALTNALVKMKKQEVTLVCIREALCGGLLLDLDNAFESAHWETKFDSLVFGDVSGIVVSDASIADAINENTGIIVRYDKDQNDQIQRLAKLAGQPLQPARIIIGRNPQ